MHRIYSQEKTKNNSLANLNYVILFHIVCSSSQRKWGLYQKNTYKKSNTDESLNSVKMFRRKNASHTKGKEVTV